MYYIMYYVLCIMYYVLCIVYYIYYILYITYYKLHIIYYILHIIYYILHIILFVIIYYVNKYIYILIYINIYIYIYINIYIFLIIIQYLYTILLEEEEAKQTTRCHLHPQLSGICATTNIFSGPPHPGAPNSGERPPCMHRILSSMTSECCGLCPGLRTRSKMVEL